MRANRIMPVDREQLVLRAADARATARELRERTDKLRELVDGPARRGDRTASADAKRLIDAVVPGDVEDPREERSDGKSFAAHSSRVGA